MENQFALINEVVFEKAKKLMGAKFAPMMQYFQEDTQMYLEEIKRSVLEKNAKLAILPAHTIKSSAKQIGVDKLSETAKQIEYLCIQIKEQNIGEYSDLERLAVNLEEEFNITKIELDKLSKNI